jgi:hypothetical protein
MASGRCYPDLSKLDAGQGHHRRAASTQVVRVSPRLGRRSWAAPSTPRAPRTGRCSGWSHSALTRSTTPSRAPQTRWVPTGDQGRHWTQSTQLGRAEEHRGRRSRVARGRSHRWLPPISSRGAGLRRSRDRPPGPWRCRVWGELTSRYLSDVPRSGAAAGARKRPFFAIISALSLGPLVNVTRFKECAWHCPPPPRVRC